MRGFSLRPNLVFNWDGAAFRIDRLPTNGTVLLERLEDGEFKVLPKEELLGAFRAGRISTEEINGQTARTSAYTKPMVELPERLREEVRRRMAYLNALEAHGAPIFTPAYTRPIAQQVAEHIGDNNPPSAATLYRWHSQYRQAKDTSSLVPRFDRRGSRDLRQEDRVLQLAVEAIEEAFRASPKAGAKDVFIRLKGKLQLENARRIGDVPLSVPSLRTVYRLLERTEVYEMAVLREGKPRADKRFRLNKQGVTVSNILERVEVDHTPLDLFLICEKSFLPLGRPTLTLLIDRYSRMPVGYYLSYGAPSAAAVMGALRHSILPKERPEQVIPELVIEHDWPCYGIMDTLVLDNGLEFHGNDLESVAFDLGIRLQYCPKYAPQFKGAIERFFRTLNHFFVHQLPGTSMARLHLRGDYDPAKHAVLTLAQFKYVLEKWLLDIYAQTLHRGLGVTPWAQWHAGQERRPLVLPSSLQAFKRRIGLVTERSLRRDGIWLHNIRYSSEALAPILQKFGEGVRLRVLYNHEDLGDIEVWSPDADDPLTVQAVDYEYAKGLTSVQHDLICSKLRENGAATEDRHARDRAKFELAQAIESLMASRKQRNRRQGAALVGLTSANPAGQVSQPKLPKPKKALVPEDQNPETFPSPLPSFQISRQEVPRD